MSPIESVVMPAAFIDERKSVSTEFSIDRWSQGATTHTTDQVAEEVPVAIVFHNVPHVVMLATPANFEDFAVGFTLSEGLVARADEIREVAVTLGADAVDVRVTVAWERSRSCSTGDGISLAGQGAGCAGRRPRRTRFARSRRWARART